MIVYFDTSALVKRYLAEAGSPAIEALWNQMTLALASEILYDEMAAMFARRRREAPADVANLDRAQSMFRAEWLSMDRVPVNDQIHTRVDELLARHALRGADAIHLASALIARDALQVPITFACADVALVNAASDEGLLIAP